MELSPLKALTRRCWAIAFALTALTIALYAPNLGNSFVEWDLEAYKGVLRSTEYGKTALALLTDFQGRIVTGYYAPLSSISLMTDKALVGSSLPVARVTLFINLLLHCLNGALLFLLLREIGARRTTAALAALIFLIHPIQVPSVLWFAQRKGLMAAAFYTGAFLAYLKFRGAGGWPAYGACAGLFICGVLSKPTASVLPAALLATEVLLPRRDRPRAIGPDANGGGAHLTERSEEPWSRPLIGGLTLRSIALLIPFFVISLAFGLLTLRTESVSAGDLPLIDRPIAAASAVWFYAGKILLPFGFSPLYPRWEINAASPLWWIPPAALGLVSALLVGFRRRVGAPFLWGAANFIIAILPAIGLLKFAYLSLSYVGDHLIYLGMIGASYCLAITLMGAIAAVSGPFRIAVGAAIVAYMALFAAQTVRTGEIWRDSTTLWTHVVEADPDNRPARTFLGHALLNAGRPEAAVGQFRQSLELGEREIERHIRRSRQLAAEGAETAAGKHRRRAVALRDRRASRHYNIGLALLHAGRVEEAVESFQQATRLRPTFSDAFNNLGVAYLMSGRIEPALVNLRRAVELARTNADAWCNLGSALMRAGRPHEAVSHFERALEVSPNSIKALFNLGVARLQTGKPEQAVILLERAARLSPQDAQIHQALADALQRIDRTAESEERLRRARELRRAR